MKYDFLIVGAGFAGSVMAERLASQLNKKVLVIDKRNHIGGNAFDEYDKNGILIHRYGPHIFHTNNEKVFKYLSLFTDWEFYEHKVLAKLGEDYYPIPINRTTINKLYKANFTTNDEVKEFLNSKKERRYPIRNSEDIIVNQVGYDLFEKFFKHYTKKQWNIEPKDLSPAVCGRVPVRFDNDDRYFTDKYQFMPKDGYTKMFERMLTHKNIEIRLNTDYFDILSDEKYNFLIYTGPIDRFFNYKYGKLPYRSIRFEWKNLNIEKVQPVGVVNYVDPNKAYTRVTEYKHLTMQNTRTTTISYEYTQADGEPYYPVPTEESHATYHKYQHEVRKINNVIFTGRLATYQYYNMDQVVGAALKQFEEYL
ncbi:MAG: UDP-galactopyranose mutase [Ignavibacteriaceae bacterium]|nr:UDP-galactopyranose mutase [Ignavibacteriaceae bacterium]